MRGDGNYRWWAAIHEDDEMYEGPFDTREDAIAAGREKAVECEEDSFVVGEADKTMVTANINEDGLAERVIEDLCDNNEECWGEDGPDEPWTSEAEAELSRMLQATVEAWLEKHPARTWCVNDWRSFDILPVAEAVSP